MAFRPIYLWPDSMLRSKAEPVVAVTDETRALIADLWQTMTEAKGAGLSGPQIGVLQRVIVVDVSYADPKLKPLAMINPEFSHKSAETITFNEACLSLPNQAWDVPRSAKVTVKYLDEQGQEQSLEADGMLAVALQHEIDHLDGIVYVDHLSALKRGMARKKADKFKRGVALAHKRRDMEVGRLQQMGLVPHPSEKAR
jgi:peptide deformylase